MSNHPNRGKKAPCRNPRPEEILRAREQAGLTQGQAAELVCAGERTWQQWEAGDRRMHPADWHLFLIRTGRQRP